MQFFSTKLRTLVCVESCKRDLQVRNTEVSSVADGLFAGNICFIPIVTLAGRLKTSLHT